MISIPIWATPKQKEGMLLFYQIASEYGCFSVTFKQSTKAIEQHIFIAAVEWESPTNTGCVKRYHEFFVAWDYETTWDQFGKIVLYWQFLFAGGDCTREVTTESFYIDLFFYMDKNVLIEKCEIT
ncbi:hypothetical protein HNW13_018630 [Shewanella sp. BF02_Schw]|uniref:hypothetical protein n=1 Tax=Shewanella sp. BF02_Schw TaxID=394908 RepID=UPI00177BD970|nr:hypothetical protein [Shewanella sp. BF02_Schw]MBO1897758.1 hypothetical protein [Shewanella sp. BF02_Schw]